MANPIIKVVLSAVDEITGVTKKAGESVSSFSDKAKAALGSLAALGVGAALGAFFKSAIEEASAAEVGMGRLGTAVRNAGGNFDALKPQLESTVASVMRLSTATDDDLRAALTNMITISGDVAGSQRNLALAADLATFKHIGLEEAANVVGKAMNGNVTAFNKLGVAGKDATTVLENARASFGGFAEKEANTFSGSLVRIKNQWGELQEAVGSAILSNGEMQGGASRLADALANLSKRVEENETALGGIGAAIPAVLDGMLRMLGFIGELIIGWQTFRIQQSTQWQLMGVAFQSMIGSMKSAAGSFLSYLPGAIGKAGQALAASGAAMVKDAAEQKELIKKGEEILLVELVGIREEGNAALRAQIQRHHKDVESESTQHGGRMKKETEEQKKQRLQLAKEEAAERERILKEVHAKLEAATKGLNLATVELAGYWQQVDREARKAKQTIELSAEEQKKLADRTQGTADAQKRVRTAAQEAREVFESNVDSAASLGISFISAANGMGKISDEAATALTSVINMGAAIAKFGIGSPEGIISIVGGLAQLIGGWGSSAAEQARKEAHMKNTRAIEELTRDLSDYNGAASGATFSGVVTALNASKYLKEDGSTGIHSRMVEFNLRAAGLTIGDAKKLADKYGIDVEKDPDGWVRLLEVLEARRFGSGEGNFADELASLTDSWGVLGVEDADDKIQALRTFAAKNIPILADALQGDFSSESGRASIIAKLRALYGDSINAKIPIADYKNATPQQFRAIIAQLLPLLGDANGLLGSGLAVGVGVGTGPVGGTPGTGGTVGLIGGPAVGLSPNLSPGLQLPGGDLPSPTGIPDTFSGVGGLTTINGGLNNAITFNITQLPGEDGEALSERILERFDRVLLMRYDAVRASEGRLPSQAA